MAEGVGLGVGTGVATGAEVFCTAKNRVVDIYKSMVFKKSIRPLRSSAYLPKLYQTCFVMTIPVFYVTMPGKAE